MGVRKFVADGKKCFASAFSLIDSHDKYGMVDIFSADWTPCKFYNVVYRRAVVMLSLVLFYS